MRASIGQIAGYMGDRQAYFATARIVDVRPDPARADHFYAVVASYLDFLRPVPFQEGQHYNESALQRWKPSLRAQRSNLAAVRGHGSLRLRLAMTFGRLRPLGAAASRERIRRHAEGGFRHGAWRGGRTSALPSNGGFAELRATFRRPSVERLVARPFRDATVSGSIKAAYHDACAVTGLKIVNGRGRSEASAALLRRCEARSDEAIYGGIAYAAGAVSLHSRQPPRWDALHGRHFQFGPARLPASGGARAASR